MPEIFYEDIEPGAVATYGPYRVDRDEMVAFGQAFDSQPFHVDEAAAASSPVGRLIASGWYSAAVQMRLTCDGWLSRSASLGGAGVEEMKWLRPVVAGDVLSLRQTILDTRVSASRPELGLVRFSGEMLNGDGKPVMRLTQLGLFARRDGPPPRRIDPPAPAPAPEPRFLPEDETAAPRVFEDIEIGRGVDLGTYAFTADRILAFAHLYDPQGYHTDPEAAAAGPFGGLAASGWHIGAGWMSRAAARLSRLAAAGRSPEIGVSPGIGDIRWLRPVYAGDVIRYISEPRAKRTLATRPGWGVLTSHNEGWNGRGERVFAFTGNAFWALRTGTDARVTPPAA